MVQQAAADAGARVDVAPLPQAQASSAAPLGLAAFALNLFLIAFSFTGVLAPEVIPLFLATGIAFGAVEAWVGTHEYRIGNSYTGLVFGSFGAFWVATGLLWLLQVTGALDFGVSSQKAMGLYFVAWSVLTLYLWVGSMFVNLIAFAVFSVLMVALILFDLWGFAGVSVKFGAWAGVVDAALAFYMSAAIVLNEMTGRIVLPVGKPVASY